MKENRLLRIIRSFLKINCKLSKLDETILNFAKKNNLKENIFKAYKISKRFDDDISSVCGSFSFLIKKIKNITKLNMRY